MAANSVLDRLTTTYDGKFKYPTLIRHKGTVLAFAIDDQRQIYYTVLDESSEWSETPTPLIFPSEIARVGFGVTDQTMLAVFKQNQTTPEPARTVLPPYNSRDNKTYDYFNSTTARLTADAPFQVLSDGQYVYVFRQARVDTATGQFNPTLQDMDATLLVDRFMLVGGSSPGTSEKGAGKGTPPRLQGKLEVRYQRSRSKTKPLNRKDTLGAKDLNGNLFYEPTQQLGFIGNLVSGRFTVLVLPTLVANVSRWQIFTQNAKTQGLSSFNIQRSADGLFNTRGSASHESEHSRAGMMLRLDESMSGNHAIFDYVQLNSAAALSDSSFTQEAWIYPEESGHCALFTDKGDQQDSLDASQSDPNTAPSVWYEDLTQLRVGFGDGSAWWDHKTTVDKLVMEQWNHVAVTFDAASKTCSIYHNGELWDQQTWTAYKGPVKKLPRFIGSKHDGFIGGVDEVRFWNRARSRQELKRGMHQRLTGLEPGLVGYWRLDEGTGTTVYDLSANQLGGDGTLNTIEATPARNWRVSTAPLEETTAVNWEPMQLKGRGVASGLTALLYYRQADSGSGYSGEPKPLKQEARVLLALATYDATKTPESDPKHYIAALDFGVSVDPKFRVWV